jgi:hypothetical protein
MLETGMSLVQFPRGQIFSRCNTFLLTYYMCESEIGAVQHATAGGRLDPCAVGTAGTTFMPRVET